MRNKHHLKCVFMENLGSFFTWFFFFFLALHTSLVFSKDFGLLVFVRKSLSIDEVS